MKEDQLRMLVTLCCAGWVMIVKTDLLLCPFITYTEIQANLKYGNATITDIGEHSFNKTYLVQIEAMRPIRDFKIFFSYSVRAFDGVVQNALVSRWVDGCEFIRRPNSDRLLKICYDAIKKYSKIPRCPYQPGNTMMLNITPSRFPVPGILPKTNFLIDVKVYTNARKDVLFESRWYGGMVNMRSVNKNRFSCEYENAQK